MKEEVESALSNALEKLLGLDAYILENNVHERSITHKLACYLEQFLHDWDVDCEYNRNCENPKKLTIESVENKNSLVLPDIIVHRRGSGDNLVVIEVKKSTSLKKKEYDLKKLKAFKEQYGYEFAIFVKVPTGSEPSMEGIHWEFIGGSE